MQQYTPDGQPGLACSLVPKGQVALYSNHPAGRQEEGELTGSALPNKTSPRFARGQQRGGRPSWQPDRKVPVRLPTKVVLEVMAVLVPECSWLRISSIVDILTLETYSRKYDHEGVDFLISLWLFTEVFPRSVPPQLFWQLWLLTCPWHAHLLSRRTRVGEKQQSPQQH